MRTTVNINDDLLEQAKVVAQSRHQSRGEVISEGLRVVIHKSAKEQNTAPVRLVAFRGKGTCPGVDLDSNAALLDAMEGR